MLLTRLISSQEKVFLDNRIEDFSPLARLSVLEGERFSFQLIYVDAGDELLPKRPLMHAAVEGIPGAEILIRDVRQVPVDRPVNPDAYDAQYLRTAPGLYPDLLTPLHYAGKSVVSRDKLHALWIEMEAPKDSAGKFEITVTLAVEDTDVTAQERVMIEVIAAPLPKQTLLFTQWFYADCLAAYYRVPAWSQAHWDIVERFARTAVKRGRNVIYTPLLTPALNVLPPYERCPSQLVKVTLNGGEYAFDFAQLDRWMTLWDGLGVKYFEMSHFFDQHKAEHSAHVYATVDGEYKLMFGWDTLALDPQYTRFLREMLTALIAHLKTRGMDKRCIYHLSDEPNIPELAHYTRLKESIADLLADYTVMDALSDVEFYQTGAIETPVPTTKAAQAFVDAGVKALWVYYACDQTVDYSNSYLAMPSWRTRSIGMQLYKYRAAGFLHWGYNYYNNRMSGDVINPYLDLGGEDWVPAGDTFVVYPGADGAPEESIRLLTLEEALQDMRAMQLAESYTSYETVVRVMEEALGAPITFESCAHSAQEMLRVREAVNVLIRDAIADKS